MNRQQGSSLRLAGQVVGAAVEPALGQDDVVDEELLFVVDVTRQEQAEESRERELAQGPERAVGVGEGALEELFSDHSWGWKTKELEGECYGVANCFVQKAVSLLL